MAGTDESYLVDSKKTAVPGTQLLDGHWVVLHLPDPFASLGVQAQHRRGEYRKDVWGHRHT